MTAIYPVRTTTYNLKIKDLRLIPNFISLSTFFILSAKYFSLLPITTCNILILGLGTFALVSCFFKSSFRVKEFIIFLVLYSIFGLLSFFYNSNADIYELLWPLGFMSIGLSYFFERPSFIVSKILFYFFCFIVIYLCFKYGSIDNVSILALSRNHVSIYAIFYFVLYILSAVYYKKTITLLPPIFFAVVCLLGVGRTGVIVAGFVLLVFLFVKIEEGELKRRQLLHIIVLLVFAILLVFTLLKIYPEIINKALLNLSSRGLETQRTLLWKDYLVKSFSNPLNLFFGSNISGTEYLNRYNLNLHNSILMLHAKYGLGGILLIFVFTIKSFHFFVKTKKYSILLVGIILLIRMNFDYTNFNDCLDLPLIYILMSPYYLKRMEL